MAQSFCSTTRPGLFIDEFDNESDEDDDACVEIPLVTPFVLLLFSGKGIMVDVAAASSVSVSRLRPSSGPANSFRDVFGDTIHTNCFPFSAGPYYAAYPEGGVAGNYELTHGVGPVPTPREMVRVETLSDDQLTTKMSVLHCMVMSYVGEVLARHRGLLQSHHEYVLSLDSMLKGYEKRVAGLTELELQVSSLKRQEEKDQVLLDNLHVEVARLSADLNRATVLEAEKDEEILRLKATPPWFASFFRGQFQGLVRKFLAFNEFSRVQGELLSLAASVGFERRLAKASLLVAQTDYSFLNKISKHTTEPLSVILQLKLDKLARPTNEFPTNVVPAPSTIASEKNEERMNAMVDGPDPEITDGATNAKPESVFMRGTSCALDDIVRVNEVGSERASSNPSDVVVALSAGKKGDGSLPSSAADEEAA
uniref:Uncharacterized protein n=1 Tax=Tanacetum cinerariifolium TaxID=118510 RepID=A0A699KBD4_TANCI|nr:hypothetical protein [Tanacetum cinerariifolium]